MYLIRLLAALSLFVACASQAGALTPQQQVAKERGLVLFNQYKDPSGDLRIAAEAGDSEAQLFLAEWLGLSGSVDEALHWYEAAARQGHPYAMIHLGRSEEEACLISFCGARGLEADNKRLRAARERVEPEALRGDGEAMYWMYGITRQQEWLARSAQAGYAHAQYRLAAILAYDAVGTYSPWDTQQSIYRFGGVEPELQEWKGLATADGGIRESVKWLGVAAAGGEVQAMWEYALALAPNNVQEAAQWLEKAADRGHVDAVVEYAANLGGLSTTFGLPNDVVRGSALMRRVVNMSSHEAGDRKAMLEAMEQTLNNSQLAQSRQLTRKMDKELPALSYFTRFEL